MGFAESKQEQAYAAAGSANAATTTTTTTCDANELKTSEYWFPNRLSFLTPKVVDLRRTVCFPYPEPKDQGPDGSCVAYAMSTAVMCLQRKERIPYNDYYLFDENEFFLNSRDHLNVTRPISKGLTFSEAVQGLCEQQQNGKHKVNWKRIGISVDNFCAALAAGNPIVFGIQVNSELREWQHNRKETVQSDFVVPYNVIMSYEKMKTAKSKNGITFHCILLVGYDKAFQVFIARNSWGNKWGHHGHFYVPFQLIRDDDGFALDAMIASG